MNRRVLRFHRRERRRLRKQKSEAVLRAAYNKLRVASQYRSGPAAAVLS